MASRARPARDDEPDLVRLYLDAAGCFELLTKDDEARLAQEIEDGAAARALVESDLSPAERRAVLRRVRRGKDAHLRFVQSNLRLVISIAKRYQASGLPLLDLVQEGNLGLIHAVDKFDWRRGFKFSTYATWWIRQAISRGIANTGRTIRLPVHVGDSVGRLRRAQSVLELRLGRTATHAELAAELGTTEQDVRAASLVAREPISLSQPMGDDGDIELADLVPDRGAPTAFEAAAAALLPAEVQKMLAGLAPREARVLILRFGLDRGEPRTLEEVGQHFDLTRERIRQIEARAMSKLRHPAYEHDVRSLLGG
jgi:DNA-directed RNA polymerase sigma subunit (sigma70/sigma32)